MNIIELERWKPSKANPRALEYAGQPLAQEVFEELKHRLDSQGCLPDEYFLMDSHWEDGREVPRDADIFCTVDYGGNEGVYLDVYLKWYDEAQKESITRSFATGKTLGENGNDLDRMFLIASAVTKAFHGDRAAHARYLKLGGVEDDLGGRVVHLSRQEEQLVIDALVEQRERQETAMSQTEQLLRRMTGSITGYMDLVGRQPLRMSDFDRAVLAIRDGELSAFKELLPAVADQAGELLVEAAGRPGAVGRRMTAQVLEGGRQFSEAVYRAACERAVDISDPEKSLFLLQWAEHCVEDLDSAFYGEMASYAHRDNRAIAKMMIGVCTPAQIAAAPSRLLEQFAADKDLRTLSALVEKGITTHGDAARTLHMLTCQKQDRWIAKELLEKRMWVAPDDYDAFRACVENDAVEVCRLLLNGGMDFDAYRALGWPCSHGETMQALAEHWSELQEEQEPEQAGPRQSRSGGLTMGGPSLG